MQTKIRALVYVCLCNNIQQIYFPIKKISNFNGDNVSTLTFPCGAVFLAIINVFSCVGFAIN
jgi:hypothetical protein